MHYVGARVVVLAKPGEEHGVHDTGAEPLVGISVFSPPVEPASYDRKQARVGERVQFGAG